MINIIKFFSPKDCWYYLDDKEKIDFIKLYDKKNDEFIEKGAELIGTYVSRANSDWSRYEIWLFNDIENNISYSNILEEIGFYEYFVVQNLLGFKTNNLDLG